MPTTIPRNGTTYDVSPHVVITLSVAPPPGAVVRVHRNGVAVGTAVLENGLVYSFDDNAVPFGEQVYTCVVEIGATLLPGNNSYPVIVTELPTVTISHMLEDVIQVSYILMETGEPVLHEADGSLLTEIQP